MKLIIFISKIFLFSALGSQVMSNKITLPQVNFCKSSKEKSMKCGMFPSHMANRPTKINLPHPKL